MEELWWGGSPSPRTNLHPATIKEFEIENDLYDHNWSHRCPEWDLPCNSARGVKLHQVKSHGGNDMTIMTEQKHKTQGHPGGQSRERTQDRGPTRSESNDILWSQSPWKCVQVRLPGVRLCSRRAPGLRHKGTRRQSNVALRQVRPPFWLTCSWVMAQDPPYVDSVVSLLTYGCESWNLTEAVMRKLNGANRQMLSRITGNDVRDESRSSTTNFDIVKHIRLRRLRWMGQILRG